MNLIASIELDEGSYDHAAFLHAGFILDPKLPNYIQPVYGTIIKSHPIADGKRRWEQYRTDTC
jgi:hypothetical protein